MTMELPQWHNEDPPIFQVDGWTACNVEHCNNIVVLVLWAAVSTEAAICCGVTAQRNLSLMQDLSHPTVKQ